jgi:hypothetical protein
MTGRCTNTRLSGLLDGIPTNRATGRHVIINAFPRIDSKENRTRLEVTQPTAHRPSVIVRNLLPNEVDPNGKDNGSRNTRATNRDTAG